MPNGLQQSEKGIAAWNGVRTHHLDAHQLDDGTWVAAIDGDSMYSVWDTVTRFSLRRSASKCVRFVQPASLQAVKG